MEVDDEVEHVGKNQATRNWQVVHLDRPRRKQKSDDENFERRSKRSRSAFVNLRRPRSTILSGSLLSFVSTSPQSTSSCILHPYYSLVEGGQYFIIQTTSSLLIVHQSAFVHRSKELILRLRTTYALLPCIDTCYH